MPANQEIMFVDISNLPSGASVDELKLNDDLARVEGELGRYTNKASKEDYALAVASGILSGAVDALFIGETPMFGVGAEQVRERANEHVNHVIRLCVGAEVVSTAHSKESDDDAKKRFPDVVERVWKVASNGVPMAYEQLADQACRPTLQGFAAAVTIQFMKFGTFKDDDGEWQLNPALHDRSNVLKALIAAVMTGFLNWVVWMSKDACEASDEAEVPEAIRRLAELAADIPMLGEIAVRANGWFNDYVEKMSDPNKSSDADKGVVGMFVSLFGALVGISGLNGADLGGGIKALQANHELAMSQGLVVIEALGKQAIPVLLNEAIVRMGFFISRLAHALSNGTQLADLDWSQILPIGNRTVDRMMTIASMTLSLADTVDAAVRATLESAGNVVLFSQRFVTRYNYVAAGRATLAVVREFVDDAKEIELLRERRVLMEARSALVVERLEEYMAQLTERVDEYIAQDLQAFFEGFAIMDQGLASGDSDLVIRGNVTIQRVLGREPQFTNQEEFDDLMASDDDFIL